MADEYPKKKKTGPRKQKWLASLAGKAKKSTLITRFGGLFVYNAQ
jgi:hypothetical protein